MPLERIRLFASASFVFLAVYGPNDIKVSNPSDYFISENKRYTCMHARTDLRLHTPTQAHTLAHTHTHIHIGLHKQINTHALTHNIYMEKESSFSFLLLFMSSSFVMMTSVVKRNVTARVISLNQLILSAIIITSSRSRRFGVFMHRSIFKSHL